MSDENKEALIALTADIVSAHVANNSVAVNDLPSLIANVHGALSGLGGPAPAAEAEKPVGAVSIRKSLANPDVIISMIDNKPYKSLKRHIGRHGYTPESYREAFGLPASYPLVSPAYSAHRREVAMKLGLGRKKGETFATKPTAEAPAKAAPKAEAANPPATKPVRKPRTLKAAVAAAKDHLGS
ncbi:hypothetical protein ACFB49_30460 [Sphingomonas sp. DBB INV C78]|uniref:MucR family transcriptional regulator n=1 Tax=Sphingomonas sp. DBB INV C78 TaxID=3349434 RepID=UPI0036D37157